MSRRLPISESLISWGIKSRWDYVIFWSHLPVSQVWQETPSIHPSLSTAWYRRAKRRQGKSPGAQGRSQPERTSDAGRLVCRPHLCWPLTLNSLTVDSTCLNSSCPPLNVKNPAAPSLFFSEISLCIRLYSCSLGSAWSHRPGFLVSVCIEESIGFTHSRHRKGESTSRKTREEMHFEKVCMQGEGARVLWG